MRYVLFLQKLAKVFFLRREGWEEIMCKGLFFCGLEPDTKHLYSHISLQGSSIEDYTCYNFWEWCHGMSWIYMDLRGCLLLTCTLFNKEWLMFSHMGVGYVYIYISIHFSFPAHFIVGLLVPILPLLPPRLRRDSPSAKRAFAKTWNLVIQHMHLGRWEVACRGWLFWGGLPKMMQHSDSNMPETFSRTGSLYKIHFVE